MPSLFLLAAILLGGYGLLLITFMVLTSRRDGIKWTRRGCPDRDVLESAVCSLFLAACAFYSWL